MSRAGRRRAGERIEPRSVITADGGRLRFPAEEGLTHLQVRRFAGCPICGRHLAPFVDRAAELRSAGLTEVVIFKSTAEHVRRYEAALPFTTLADPEAAWYAELGVRSGLASLLHPHAVAAYVAGVVQQRSLQGSLTLGDHLGLPADFLLEPDGRVVDCAYGTNAADGWSVDEVLQRSGALR